MHYKVIAILIICLAAAAAGCTGYHSGITTPGSGSQEAVHSMDSSGSYADMKVAYAPNAAPVPAIRTESSMGGSTVDTAIETKVIRTAYVTVEVRDVPGSVEALKSMAASAGGYLSSTNVQKDYRDRMTGSVVMRIPQQSFESTLAGVKAIGTVKSASTQGEDVTEEFVDLEAQKTSYQNQLAQYNAIMKQSTKIEDIIRVQEQIDRVQTELNRLEGRLKYLNSRVDFSTITVNLQEPEPVGGDTGHSFVTTINEGIAGFIGMIDAIIILFFTLLPLAILVVLGWGVHRWYQRRKGTGQTPPADEKKETR